MGKVSPAPGRCAGMQVCRCAGVQDCRFLQGSPLQGSPCRKGTYEVMSRPSLRSSLCRYAGMQV